jgi:hypothetical protein
VFCVIYIIINYHSNEIVCTEIYMGSYIANALWSAIFNFKSYIRTVYFNIY